MFDKVDAILERYVLCVSITYYFLGQKNEIALSGFDQNVMHTKSEYKVSKMEM